MTTQKEQKSDIKAEGNASARPKILDAGLAFMVGDTLLFMSGVGVPFYACMAAVVTIAAMNGTKKYKPSLLDNKNFKNSLLNKSYNQTVNFLKDDRASLRLSSVALTVVTASALLSGLWVAAGASAAFTMGNYFFAESIQKAKLAKANDEFNANALKTKKKNTFKSQIKGFVTGPDGYVAVGLTCAAVMAASVAPIAALPMVPFIIGSTVIAVQNAAKGRHESYGHPKAIAALACTGAGVAGLLMGNPLPALANFIFAGTNLSIEAAVTPGGLRQVARNFVNAPALGLKRLRQKMTRKHAKQSVSPVVKSLQTKTPSTVTNITGAKNVFNASPAVDRPKADAPAKTSKPRIK